MNKEEQKNCERCGYEKAEYRERWGKVHVNSVIWIMIILHKKS